MRIKVMTNEGKISSKLKLGILFFPYIFAWFTLRRGITNGTRVFAFLWMFLVIVMVRLNDSDNTDAIHKNSGSTSKVASVTINKSKPFDLPLKHEPESEVIDAVTIVENLSNLLGKASWYEIFRFTKNSEDLMGLNCSLAVCKNLRIAIRALSKAASDPKDYDTRMAAEGFLKDAAKDVALLKKSQPYRILNKKPLFLSDDGVYVIEHKINSRAECKLLGDTLKIFKKKNPVVFVEPGKSISRKIASNEYQNISCVYIYNYGLKNITRVLLTEEIAGNWD
jgi:hypothetical protein